MLRRAAFTSLLCAFVFLLADLGHAQSGKISGTVTDAETGDPLPGVNVLIEGTQRGATTNADGFYTILNLQPGTYSVRFSFVGFAQKTIQEVQVNTDLTTTLDVEMEEQTQQLQEVTVQAEERVIKQDISANVANINASDMRDIPVAGLEEVISLQAGVEPGMQVRGGGLGSLNMIVDGQSMRSGRNNEPFTGISYTSIKQAQLQTGGFSAKYGNVRSGLINVSTVDPPRDAYTVDVMGRYSPPQQKTFGGLPGLSNPDAYWIDPFLPDEGVPQSEDVAYVGTQNGNWDGYTQNQYPTWQGWNTVSEGLMADDDPSNDLTPEQLIEVFEYRHRKDFDIQQPDYVMDGTIGGPVPGISSALGDLRFLASFRTVQQAYPVPQQREAYENTTGRVKLITNVSSGFKVRVEGMRNVETGIKAGNWTGDANVWDGENPVYPWSGGGMINAMGGDQRDGLFAWHFYNNTDIERTMLGGQITHTLSPNTFYTFNLQRQATDYSTYRGERRSSQCVREIGPVCLDEAPWGFVGSASQNSYSGLRLSGHWGKPKDSSDTKVWQSNFNLTSQLNQYNTLTTGLEFIYNDLNMNFGRVDSFHTVQQHWFRWNREPIQGAAYLEDKLEFQGMIANVGLRLDYFDGNGKWYDYDWYADALSAQGGADNLDQNLPLVDIDPQVFLSPRIGVSFPISLRSKIYFNYGHFRQMLNPMNVFRVRAGWLGGVQQIGNPEHPMPRTIAYELGYEQNLFDQYLVRLTGYYRDVTNQTRQVNFQNLLGTVNYSVSMPFNYQDIRGFEATIRKNRGQWFRGFANFTFQVTRSGNFGLGQHFENQATQNEYLRQNRFQKNSPVPQPFANFNLEFLTPVEFGPDAGGFHPLGDWRLSLLGQWRDGPTWTWTYQTSAPEVENNVSYRDYVNFDMRLSKNLDISGSQIQLFADVSNVFNIRHMHQYAGFEGDFDWEDYMTSLHLPSDTFDPLDSPPYAFIPGDDQPGDFRKPGEPYVPIEIVGSSSDLPTSPPDVESDRRVLYYDSENEQYMEFQDGSLQNADGDFVDEVLDNKQYINMPNEPYHTFLNPRRVQFGLRLSF